MNINLRKNVLAPIQAMISLFKKRKENITKRELLEKEITGQNTELIKYLSDLFMPISKKSDIGFNINIKDNCIEISTNILLKKMLLPIRIGIVTTSIADLMTTSNNFNSCLLLTEKYLRYLKVISRKELKSGKLKLNPPQVTVSINTKTRYF